MNRAEAAGDMVAIRGRVGIEILYLHYKMSYFPFTAHVHDQCPLDIVPGIQNSIGRIRNALIRTKGQFCRMGAIGH